MNNEQLQKKIKELIVNIKSNSKDSKFADKLVYDLLSVKGQLDLKPTEIYIPTENITYRHPFRGAYEIMEVNNGAEYIFATKGFRMVVKPYSLGGNDEYVTSSLFSACCELCTLCKSKITDIDKKEEIDGAIGYYEDTIGILCTKPLTSFLDINETYQMAIDEYNRLEELQKRAGLKLQTETPKKNMKFEQDINFADKIEEYLQK